MKFETSRSDSHAKRPMQDGKFKINFKVLNKRYDAGVWKVWHRNYSCISFPMSINLPNEAMPIEFTISVHILKDHYDSFTLYFML